VTIGGLDAGNVVFNDNGPVIIKFAYAEMDHNCPGVSECDELLDAQDTLQVAWPAAYGHQAATYGHKGGMRN
jgi:hypothetical protein